MLCPISFVMLIHDHNEIECYPLSPQNLKLACVDTTESYRDDQEVIEFTG